MSRSTFSLAKKLFLVPAAPLLLTFLAFTSVEAEIYVHYSPLSFSWEPASGPVDHYNVYLSVDEQPFQMFTTTSSNTCLLPVTDSQSYMLQVEAEDNANNTGPMSDPSELITVFLNGSQTDTDGDGMPDDWEQSNLLNPYNPLDGDLDLDEDGLKNKDEFLAGTLPNNPDTDGDGVSDLEEYEHAELDPLNPADNIPIANAGPDQEHDPTLVTLDGSASIDPNGDYLSFTWDQREGPAVNLSDPNAVKPTCLAIKSDTYRFELTVNDGKTNSATDEVLITIRNVAPTADAGPDIILDVETEAGLNGSRSQDPNEDPLSFQWSQTEGGEVILEGADRERASFIPHESGIHRFQLVVFDGLAYSSPDEVIVTVNALNLIPTAVAGPDQTGEVNDTIVLDGSGSTDPEGAALQFEWSQEEGPAPVTLNMPSSRQPVFQPIVPGIYQFRLTVSDGENLSAPDYVTVTIQDHNQSPIASIAKVDPVTLGDWVVLDGQSSSDPDNDPLSYCWTQITGAQVTLVDSDKPTAGFYAVTEGVFLFQLYVDDGRLQSLPAQIEIIVNGDNQIPVADAGMKMRRTTNTQICLDGSGSYDPDESDQLTFSWTQESGPGVTLYQAETVSPCFTPLLRGRYIFSLTVYDGKEHSSKDYIEVRVKGRRR